MITPFGISLSDDLVSWIDDQVSNGTFASRDELIAQAVDGLKSRCETSMKCVPPKRAGLTDKENFGDLEALKKMFKKSESKPAPKETPKLNFGDLRKLFP